MVNADVETVLTRWRVFLCSSSYCHCKWASDPWLDSGQDIQDKQRAEGFCGLGGCQIEGEAAVSSSGEKEITLTS